MQTAVRAVAMTGRGRVREGNEDAVLVFGWFTQSSEPAVVDLRAQPSRTVLCAVADGMGGHAAGEVASATALVTAADRYLAWTTPGETAAGLVDINAELYDLANRGVETSGMGTTIAGVLVAADHAVCFNIGDSRVYDITRGTLTQLTVDDAVTGGLTQALGDPPDPGPVPHVLELPLSTPTRLFLCTDGISSVLDPGTLHNLCRIPDPVALVDTLRTTVYGLGAPDNLTAVVLDIP
ncbi:PP2C family protein-serine/threonine phosphatase [Actinokineospora enzanensis]|uniref:PP2C family protein-serine/threonine phosphatase n=1 Tax=Actinokineospora enzanensis TaxID=155975 RepID=UPI0003614FE9|nr:protein phosphatase 2C domain-containing protein [Actinokineospora enzanensis]